MDADAGSGERMKPLPVARIVVLRRGRPRVEEPRTSVSTWVPATCHDQLIKQANRNERSVSAELRQLILRQLKQP